MKPEKGVKRNCNEYKLVTNVLICFRSHIDWNLVTSFGLRIRKSVFFSMSAAGGRIKIIIKRVGLTELTTINIIVDARRDIAVTLEINIMILEKIMTT